MSELPVPDAAVLALANATNELSVQVAAGDEQLHVRAIARPVLAAFLREQVEATRYDGGFDDAHALHLAEMLDLGWL